MIDRRVLVLLVLDGALLAAIGLSSLRPSGPRPIAFRLPALDAAAALRITRTGQPPVELRRVDGAWTAGGDPIDPQGFEALRRALGAPVPADLALGAAGEALEDYGLGEHAITVSFEGAAPEGPVRIGRVVDGRRTFVWPVGGDRIFRVRGDLARAFDRPADHWTDRRLIPIELAELGGLRVTRGAALDWAAERPGPSAPWALTHPPGQVAGQAELGAVANTLATARVDGFAPGDGFVPEQTIEATALDGRRFAVELQRADGGRMRARLPGRRRVAVLPRHLAVFLGARAADLRDRRVFEADVATLSAVAIGPPHPLRVVRGNDGRWRMAAPREAGPLPDGAVDGWLSALVGLQAVGFADRVAADAFAEPWRIDLAVGGRQQTLEIGAPYGNGARLARRIARPNRVMVLAASALEVLRPDPAVLLGEQAPD